MFSGTDKCLVKIRDFTILILLITSHLTAPAAVRQKYYHRTYRYHYRHDNHGMYNRYYHQHTHSVTCKFGANYFAGDIEMPGNLLTGYKDILSDYANGSNNSVANNIGADVAIMYCYHPIHPLAMRASVTMGYLHGYCDFYRETEKGNGVFEREFERQFQSCMIEYAIGVEYYPIKDVNFFVYLGFGAATSFIHRDFNAYLAPTNPELNVHDKINCTVPMLPVGIGYKWEFDSDWTFGFEMVWHTALCDKVGMNMDGYQSGYIYNGHEYYPVVEGTNRWQDSFMELGFTIGGVFGQWKTNKWLWHRR